MSQFLFRKEKARPVPSPREGQKKPLNEIFSASEAENGISVAFKR
jgi:hypothetical protein